MERVRIKEIIIGLKRSGYNAQRNFKRSAPVILVAPMYAAVQGYIKIATHLEEMVTEPQNALEYSWNSISLENVQESSTKPG